MSLKNKKYTRAQNCDTIISSTRIAYHTSRGIQIHINLINTTSSQPRTDQQIKESCHNHYNVLIKISFPLAKYVVSAVINYNIVCNI